MVYQQTFVKEAWCGSSTYQHTSPTSTYRFLSTLSCITSHCASGPEIATASYQDPAQGVHPQSHNTDGHYPTSNQVGYSLIDTNPAAPSQRHPQHVSFELYSKYLNTLLDVICEKENLRNEIDDMLGEVHSLRRERFIKLENG